MEQRDKKIIWKEIIPMSIIDEGKQLSIRIPKKIVEAGDINPKTDIFVFEFNKKTLHLQGSLEDKELWEESDHGEENN